MDRNSTGPGSYILAGLAVLVGIVVIVGGFAWLISIHGVDAGHVAIVKEGGPFDGRNLKEVRGTGIERHAHRRVQPPVQPARHAARSH
jgi:hypothetical protein